MEPAREISQRVRDRLIAGGKARWINARYAAAPARSRSRIAHRQAPVPHVPRVLDLEIRAGAGSLQSGSGGNTARTQRTFNDDDQLTGVA